MSSFWATIGGIAIAMSILHIYSEWKRRAHDTDDDEFDGWN